MKIILTIAIILIGLFAADQHYAHGRYTDGVRAMLHDIQRSIRW